MSTKTSIKRIALVAVSALGFGLLSVVPANAANTVLTGVSPYLATTTGTATAGRLASFPVTVTTTAADATASDSVANAQTVTCTPVVTGKPAASSLAAANSVARGNNASAIQFAKMWLVPSGSKPDGSAGVWSVPAATSSAVTISTSIGVATDNDTEAVLTRKTIGTAYFVADIAGTYTLSLSCAASGTGATTTPGTVDIAYTVSSGTVPAVIQRSVARIDQNDSVVMQSVGLDAKLQVLSAPSTQTYFVPGAVFDSGSSSGLVATPVTGTTVNYSWAVSNGAGVAAAGVVEGTYTFRAFDDVDGSGTFNAADGEGTTLTVRVALDAKRVVGLTLQYNTAVTSGSNSTDLAIQTTASIYSAAGFISYLATGATVAADEEFTFTVGALTEDTSVAAAADSVGTGQFGYVDYGDGTGVLYIGGDVAVGNYTVTAVGPGGTAATHGDTEALTVIRSTGTITGMTADASSNLNFDTTYNGVAHTTPASATIQASTTQGTITFRFTGGNYAAGGAVNVPITVTLSGTTGASDLTYPAVANVLPDGTGSFSIVNAAPSSGDGYTVSLPKTGSGVLGFTVTYLSARPTFKTASQAPAGAFTVKNLSTNTMSAVLTNNYGAAEASKLVTITVAGRNPQTAQATTGADGSVSFTLEDKAAVATATTDTVTFSHAYISSAGTAASATAVFTITYTATGVVVGNVLVTSDANSALVDTVQQLNVVAATAIITYTATISDTSGLPLTSGNVVTWSGGADDIFVGGVKTSTTTALGQATIKVYRNKVGYATISASIAGVSASRNVVLWTTTAFAGTQASPGNTNVFRNISAVSTGDAVAGGVIRVTATVTDRWGNGVSGVPVAITITGPGRLLSPDVTGKATDSTGQVQYNITSNAGETGAMTANLSVLGGQTLDTAGYITVPGGSAQVLVSGVTAGNDKIAVTSNFTKDTSTSTADALLALAKAIGTGNEATAAADAALEAIDAANAATDAANLAAEAADAATVAAEEARDAADAATAAVEALASEVATLTAALKAQITALANTVAKIAKKVKA